MGIRIVVKNAVNNSSIKMELEPNEKMIDIIESAAEFWKKDSGAYVLKKGKMLLRGDMSVAEVNLTDEDTLELIPDPEGGCNGSA